MKTTADDTPSQQHSNAKRPRALLALNRAVLFAWIGFAATTAASAIICFAKILHPSWVWIGMTLPIFIVAELVGVVMLGLLLYRGPRWASVMRGSLLLVPALVMITPLILGSHRLRFRSETPGEFGYSPAIKVSFELAACGVSSVLDGLSRVVYPQRLEGKHVVMIYDRAPHAREQVAAMDQHIEHLEKILGQTCRGKVHWVRGPLLEKLGVHSVYLNGMAFGSRADDSADGNVLSAVDRHEVAHFVIEHLAGPAMLGRSSLLGEGWAEANSGIKPGQLARRALVTSAANPTVGLAELTSARYFQSAEQVIYWHGGAFADFLLRRFGGPIFFDLHRSLKENELAEACERVLGMNLTEVENLYFEDLGPRSFEAQDPPGFEKLPVRLPVAHDREIATFLWIDSSVMQKQQNTADVAARNAFIEGLSIASREIRRHYATVSMTGRTRFSLVKNGVEKGGEVLEDWCQTEQKWRYGRQQGSQTSIIVCTPAESLYFVTKDGSTQSSVSRSLPKGETFDQHRAWCARLLPYRCGRRDITQVLVDPTLLVRDITAVKDSDDEVVELRFESPAKRMTGRLRLDPMRGWAVREYEEVQRTAGSRETVETFRSSYGSDPGNMPVLSALALTRRSPVSAYDERTEITRVSVDPLDAKSFMKEGLTALRFPE